MAIKLMDILETAGDFPVMEAHSIGVPGGKRLNELIDDDGKIASESLPDDVGGSDPRVDELLDAIGDMVDEESGKINPEYLPEMEVTDPRVDDLVTDVNDINTILSNIDSMFDTEGRLLPSVLPKEKKPISIDLSDFKNNGTIVERYADGSAPITTVEFDADGNPSKITDGNGNVTVLTW